MTPIKDVHTFFATLYKVQGDRPKKLAKDNMLERTCITRIYDAPVPAQGFGFISLAVHQRGRTR